MNVKKIIKIQSVFRGIKAREIYKAMIIQTKVSKYPRITTYVESTDIASENI